MFDSPLQIILTGDFNTTPRSTLYNFLTEGQIDCKMAKRDMMSGQSYSIKRRKLLNLPTDEKVLSLEDKVFQFLN